MTAEKNNLDQSYSDQLSDFEGQLKQTMDDESLLQDVHRAIRNLLKEHRESEADIRQILSDRFESGTLRQESFQLVQRMLERVISDDIATMPGMEDSVDPGAPDFGETDVIPPSTVVDLPEERLQVGSVLRDRFLLQQRIAGGSMGVVYKALDRRLAEADGGDPWVAIKVLSPKLSRNGNALRALQQEAVKGRCLSHPNIVRFLDLDRDDELYFIVMEWLDGRSLADILDDARSKKIDVSTALDIVRQIGNALDYAHRCGVVHADVKPGNVILTPSGQVKLFDFGVARIRQQQSNELSKFDPSVLGATTPAYSSMQVLTGEDPVPADDVFSLACLLYRLIAGYRVFGPRNAAQAAESGMEPQRPQGLSDSQWKALKKALAYSRVARYSSPKIFVDDLLEVEDEVRLEISDDDTADHEMSEPDKARWPLVTGVVVLALLLAYLESTTGLISKYIPSAGTNGNSAPVLSVPVTNNPPDTARTPASSTMAMSPVSPAIEIDRPVTVPASDADAEISVDTRADIEVGQTEIGEVPVLGELAENRTDDLFVEDYSDVIAEPPGATYVPVNREAPELEQRAIATHSLRLAGTGAVVDEINVTLREGEGPAVIDLHRTEGVGVPLTLRIAEIGFSGNQSPWSSGAYDISNNGIVEFSANQNIAQTTISVSSNSRSDPDRQATLLIRVSDAPESRLALINLVLEDDDRREFEANLPPNTVAFSSNRVSVRESEPAVQIDVLRFNPDAQSLEVDYLVRDITATESSDYFLPGITTFSFAPNQRTLRLLIPLVQDSVSEIDETFVLEIISGATNSDPNIHRRITVMIRDDDFGTN